MPVNYNISLVVGVGLSAVVVVLQVAIVIGGQEDPWISG